jgi:beta-N-acetylhexosaminidase
VADISAKAFISGCMGLVLSPDELAFFRNERPFGLILFQRNCRDPEQVRALVATFRQAVGRSDAPVLIDQEGGRVRRLKPPHWPDYPAAAAIAGLHAVDASAGVRAAWLHGQLIAADLTDLGIDADCAPVLDVLVSGASDAIGNRSFGGDPTRAAVLGGALAEGLLDGGVLPVMKHIPGQGRATADSHVSLPVVGDSVEALAAADFVPFAALAKLPMAMTAHVVYSAIDPHHPATVSPAVIRDIIRGRIGFEGLLLSDDVSMHALSGDYRERTAAIYAAGCDIVLHCNGRAEEMQAVADASPELSGIAAERAVRALQAKRAPRPFDRGAAREEYDSLLASVAGPVAG